MAHRAYRAPQIDEAIAHARRTGETIFVRYTLMNLSRTLVALGKVEDDLDVSVDAHVKLIELTRKES